MDFESFLKSKDNLKFYLEILQDQAFIAIKYVLNWTQKGDSIAERK